jgi:hypothetical protein
VALGRSSLLRWINLKVTGQLIIITIAVTCPEEEAALQQDHVATPIPSLRYLNDDNGNLIDQVAAYVADPNKVMEQEGHHADEGGQETAWGQTREGSLDYYLETRARRYIRDM